jgi:hypothetical protein
MENNNMVRWEPKKVKMHKKSYDLKGKNEN